MTREDSPAALPEAMTGRASPAKAAEGDAPVFAYIASLPQPQRGIAEAVDALAARGADRRVDAADHLGAGPRGHAPSG